jgi:nucleoside-diphosphate-sugar epimerase
MTRTCVMLTGANGFVGRQVLAALPEDVELHCISRSAKSNKKAVWHQGDLRERKVATDLIQAIKPTHLVHLAWNTEHGRFWHAQDNLEWRDAGIAMARAFAENGGQRMIMTGTGAEYAANAPSPIDELTAELAPATLYAEAKHGLFLAATDIALTYDISFAWARIFNAFGPGEPAGRLVPSIINAILMNQIAKCSSGLQKRDFVDSRDLGRAIAKLIFANVDGPINLGSGEDASIGDIARMIGTLMHRPDLIMLGSLPDRAGEPRVHIPDLKRMHDELKYTPKINHKLGLQDAIDWWRENLRH